MLDEPLYDRAVSFSFPVFHRVVIKVPMEFFGRREPSFQERVFAFLGDAYRGLFKGLMAVVGPSAFLGNRHDGVCGSSPELFCTLENVATVKFSVGKQ